MSIDRAVKAVAGLFLPLIIVAIALIVVPQEARTQEPPSVTPLNGQNVIITKVLETNLVIPGQPITYTIYYQITGTSVTTVTITDALPISTTWQDDTAPTLGFTRTQTTTHAIWTTPTLSVGSGSFQLSLDVPSDISTTILTNTVSIGAFLTETTFVSNTFPLTATVAHNTLFLPLVVRNYPTLELPPPIPVGAHPKSLAISEDHNRVYVTLFDDDGSGNPGGGGALAAIDLDTHQVLTKTTAGLSRPMGIAILSDTLYIVNNGSNTVSVMDAISLTTLQTITVGSEPFGVALTSDRVYVTNFADGSLSIIDPVSNTVITTVAVGVNPAFPAAWGDCAYVPNHGGGAEGVTVVCDDGDEVYGLREEWGYFAATFYPNPQALYNPLIILSRRDDLPGLYEVSAYPPYGERNPLRKKDMLDAPPFAIAYNPTTEHLLVVAADNDELHIVWPGGYHTGTVWPLPQQHEGEERRGGQGVAAVGNWVWVANYAAGSVSVLYDPP